MTAEIALLNKMAVTLAADSAVTIGTNNGPKVYNSADKIFEGTNHDPIGVMVYNSPELGGIPVESIVKMYRDRNCRQHYPTVVEYARAFLDHVEGLHTPEITISSKVQSLIAGKSWELQQRLRGMIDQMLREPDEVAQDATLDEFLEAVADRINSSLDAEIAALAAMPEQPWSAGLTVEDVLEAHRQCIAEQTNFVFDGEPLPDDRKERVIQILAWSLLREYQRSQLTGLVFAGFGQDEIFPSLVAYEVYGIIAGRLKHVQTSLFDIDRRNVDAAVIPFAQKEMVDRFMFGLDEEFLGLSQQYFHGALGALKAKLDDLLEGGDPGVRAAIGPAVDEILSEFSTQVVPEHLSRLHLEFSDMVRSMPKQELAALSESLVHITSLKRKFSAGAESVGGPIDVAMITRAEGFVWVKRKHYFDPALNPRYFFRRYGGRAILEAAGEQQPGQA